MRKPLVQIALVLCFLCTALQASQYYATTGNYSDFTYDPQFNSISYTNHLYEMARYGISPSRIIITDSEDSPVPGQLHGYQITARILGNVLQDSQLFTGQPRIILDLNHLFFERKLYPGGVACAGYSTPHPVTARWELRPDYQARLDDFKSLLLVKPSAGSFEFISVNPESGCVPAQSINDAAQAVKTMIPGVLVAAGYPISIDVSPTSPQGPGHGTNHIGRFPTGIDRIITWSYGVFDPANPAHPLNSNGDFPNYYSILTGKLRWWQQIDWVVDAHFLNCRHGSVCEPGGTGIGWVQGLHHAQAARNWCNWLPGQARVAGQIAFSYHAHPDDHFFMMAEMPQIVRDTHANISSGLCQLPHTVVQADAFTGVALGGNPQGRAAEVGGGSWITNGQVRFASGGPLGRGDVTGLSATNPIMVLAFNPAQHGNKRVTLTADLNPAGANWIALGLSNNAVSGWWADGQIWVLLKNSRHYNVLANGTAISLSGGEKFDSRLTANGYNRVELSYAPATRQVELWVNGWQLLAPTTLPAGFNPAVQHAGWSGLNVSQGQTRLDSFEIKLTP